MSLDVQTFTFFMTLWQRYNLPISENELSESNMSGRAYNVCNVMYFFQVDFTAASQIPLK